ncbi:MAG: ABC-2 family transporter protein [Planctomycetota bacterium]
MNALETATAFGGARHRLRVFREMLAVWTAYMAAYRFEIMLWMVATMLPLIMMGVWIEAGASGLFPDITAASVARYFLAVFVIRQVTVVWVAYEFEYFVVTGRLSPVLLHPIDPVWRFVFSHLGEQLVRLPFFAGVLAIAIALYPAALREGDGWWMPSVGRALGFFGLVYAAFALRFLLQYTIAMLAFWIEKVGGFESLSYLPYLFLSGMLFPLEVLPPGVANVLLWTPFPYLVWFPAKLLVDGDVELVRGLLTIGGWFVALLILNRFVWRRGLAHYSAMGA